MEYRKELSEPWFTLIKLGLKKVEGRLRKTDFLSMKKGDTIVFWNNSFKFMRELRVKITSMKDYVSFEDYLEAETMEKCLPGLDTIPEGIALYRSYNFTKELEETLGVVAIRFRKVK